jgi:hypothetical protein
MAGDGSEGYPVWMPVQPAYNICYGKIAIEFTLRERLKRPVMFLVPH